MQTDSNPPEKLLSLAESARIAGVSVVTARKLVATTWREFSLRIGRQYRVSPSGLDGWIKTQMARRGA